MQDVHDPCGVIDPEGAVQVSALDMNADGRVDRWEIEPLPDTDSKFQLLQQLFSRKSETVVKDYGDYRLPFLLTLDRLNYSRFHVGVARENG